MGYMRDLIVGTCLVPDNLAYFPKLDIKAISYVNHQLGAGWGRNDLISFLFSGCCAWDRLGSEQALGVAQASTRMMIMILVGPHTNHEG